MAYFRRNLKYNIKEKLMGYEKKLDNLNFLIEIIIKLNNKFYKLVIETHYKNSDSKVII